MTEPKEYKNQISREIAEMYKRMTDPEEREKQRLKDEEEETIEQITLDAGL